MAISLLEISLSVYFPSDVDNGISSYVERQRLPKHIAPNCRNFSSDGNRLARVFGVNLLSIN